MRFVCLPEIQNRQSLETLLAREEEVKRKAIINKEVYSGPLIRFYSKGGMCLSAHFVYSKYVDSFLLPK